MFAFLLRAVKVVVLKQIQVMNKSNHIFKNICKSMREKGTYEPRHEKTCLRGLRPGKTQTGLLSYRLARGSKFRI